jgi:CRISPR/Cas system-associated exonuclease Cas4 (RecB family)
MPPLPESKHTTARKIFEWYESKKEDHREHLGASLIGHHCDRFLWLTFRWAASPQFEGRVLRLFNTGKREETRVYEELRAIGVELHTDDNGQQISCRDNSGHFGGSLDGIGLGFPEAPKTWAVLEIKTANAKAWTALKAKGVQAEKPQHYAQMQVYMGLMKLDRALYISVNKDTDDLYTEWVHSNRETFGNLLHRAERTIKRIGPAGKISEDPSNWQCKMCDMYKLCHQGEPAEVNCRTCVHATPVEGGKWHCHEHDKELTAEAQRKGCDSHIFIPDLVAGKAIDGERNFVEYFVESTGETFKNGPAHVTSKEVVRRGRKKSERKEDVSNLEGFNDPIPFGNDP